MAMGDMYNRRKTMGLKSQYDSIVSEAQQPTQLDLVQAILDYRNGAHNLGGSSCAPEEAPATRNLTPLDNNILTNIMVREVPPE